MTDLATLAGPTARPEPDRDHYGRYRIPHPETGKTQAWTRATTLAGTIADQYGLTKWKQRMTLHGVAHRADLYAEAASIQDADQAKAQLDKLVEAAMEAAGSSSRARLGTALHAFAEQIDAGADITIPAPYDADIAAYRHTMSTAGVQIIPEMIERIVVNIALGVAGTFDRVVNIDGQLYIADLKTGRDLSYSWHEIAAQLAIYATADTIYDVATGLHSPMPVVNQDRGLVMHLPVGEASCTLHWVDLAQGRHAVELCTAVREWRKVKGLAEPMTVTVASEPTHVSTSVAQVVDDLAVKHDAYLLKRISKLAPFDVAKIAVRHAWPEDVPVHPPWTPDERTQIEDAIRAGERAIAAPFPDEAPSDDPPTSLTPPQEPTPTLRPRSKEVGTVDANVCTQVAASIRQMAPDRLDVFRRWVGEARRGGRPLRIIDGEAWNVTTHAVVVAIGACLADLWDDADPDALTRAALRLTIGDDDVQPTFTTGALLGSLTSSEARRLTQIAHAFGRSEPDVCAQLGALVA